uniref:Uncharacterized protein n=1 Tax=Spongospora subterranea TaxID=70186 RepID=A0A0H5QX13_9EUKA|eukprot:CRZ06475.1 hypothetical protein [Spongospora subterranea]
MGRPACAARSHFTKLEVQVNKTVYFFNCIHCFKAHADNPDSSPELELVYGRKECFDVHLETCHFCFNDMTMMRELSWVCLSLASVAVLLMLVKVDYQRALQSCNSRCKKR